MAIYKNEKRFPKPLKATGPTTKLSGAVVAKIQARQFVKDTAAKIAASKGKPIGEVKVRKQAFKRLPQGNAFKAAGRKWLI